jgi:hypothetical protein
LTGVVQAFFHPAEALAFRKEFMIMKSRSDIILKVAKEVAVKYIETGRLPLSNFSQGFSTIYQTIEQTVPAAKSEED